MWKNIKSVDGNKIEKLYEINENGIIRNINTKRIYIIQDNGSGYKCLSLKLKNGGRKVFYIHRIVYNVFIKQIDTSLVINHLDLNRANNNYSNLELCTQKENIQYSIKKGSINNKGSNNSNSKLKEKTVHKICKMLEKGKSSKEISEKLNIDISTINEYQKFFNFVKRIINKKSYTDISNNYF